MRWNADDTALLRERFAKGDTCNAIALLIGNCSGAAVASRAARLGLKHGTPLQSIPRHRVVIAAKVRINPTPDRKLNRFAPIHRPISVQQQRELSKPQLRKMLHDAMTNTARL